MPEYDQNQRAFRKKPYVVIIILKTIYEVIVLQVYHFTVLDVEV